MRLAYADGSAMRLTRSATFSAAWGAGASLGVALGAVLTAVSGSGAPGIGAVDVGADLVTVPLLAGAVVFGAHFGFTLALAAFRGRRSGEAETQADEGGESRDENGVERQVGPEVEAPEG